MRLTLLLLAACDGGAGPSDAHRTQTVDEGADSAPPVEQTTVDTPADTDVAPLPECPELQGMRWRTERRLDGAYIPFGPGELFYFGVDGVANAVVAGFDLPSPPDPATRGGYGHMDLYRDDGRLIASTGVPGRPTNVISVHDANGVAFGNLLYEKGLITGSGSDRRPELAWVDGSPATFHFEMEVPSICRSVRDVPVILRVNATTNGQYPLVWRDRGPAPLDPPPDTDAPPVEHGGGDSGLP